MSITNPYLNSLREEANLTGYLMAVLDAQDILIQIKKEFPGNETLVETFSERISTALQERKLTSFNVLQSDLG